jgi:hypothetical protein
MFVLRLQKEKSMPRQKMVVLALALACIFTQICNGEIITYRPGPEDGIDMWYSSYYIYNGSHVVDDSKLQAGGWGDQYTILLKFDLGCLPRSATSVVLYLMPYDRGDSSTPVGMNVYGLTTAWDEKNGWSGTLSGGLLGTLPAPTPDTWYGIDITSIYNAWQNGTYPNEGFGFLPTGTNNQFNMFRSSDYTGDVSLRPKLIIEYTPDSGEPFKPCFPLKDHTPYLAEITSVVDHSVPSGFYTGNGVVKAYNGEMGSINPYHYTSTIVGYERSDGKPFSLPLLTYTDDGASNSGRDVLFYDGHSGYDYKANWQEAILAATDGTLCVSTSRTMPSGGTSWRNTTKCPYGNDTSITRSLTGSQTSWDRWHAFYIVHPGGAFSTWYLHADSLSSGVWDAILQNGYATVKRLQTVGFVGNWGLGCTGTSCKHLHFEVRNGMGTGNVLDPYGTGGSSSIMWGTKP